MAHDSLANRSGIGGGESLRIDALQFPPHQIAQEQFGSPSGGELSARVALGIPDSASDFTPDEITAMDAGYDLLHAISFTKGCYVGQEVTARMHYKNIARKGFFIVEGAQELHSGAALMLGDKQVGSLSSASGTTALAFLKFDDAFSGAPMLVENSPVRLTAPGWMQPKIVQFHASAAKQ